jgi:hypothetical protein
MVQVVPDGIEPLLRVTVVPPLAAVTVAAPPQPVNVEETGLARKTLAGRLSVMEAWVKVTFAPLVILMVSWLVPPAQILLGLKLLLIEGTPAAVTFRVALAGLVLLIDVPPPVELKAPTGIVLILVPGVVDVTLTETVQDPGVEPDWAGTVPPLKDMVVEPAGAVTVPPQVFPDIPTTVIPAGKLSVQDAFVSGNALGLKMVTRRSEVAPAAMDIGEKVLLISAGKVMPCAYAFCPGLSRKEIISTTTRKGFSVFCIFYPMYNE